MVCLIPVSGCRCPRHRLRLRRLVMTALMSRGDSEHSERPLRVPVAGGSRGIDVDGVRCSFHACSVGVGDNQDQEVEAVGGGKVQERSKSSKTNRTILKPLRQEFIHPSHPVGILHRHSSLTSHRSRLPTTIMSGTLFFFMRTRPG